MVWRCFMRLAGIATAVAIGVFCQGGSVDAAREYFLSVGELKALYANKSWRWKDGVGYFGPTGRFQAYSGSKDKRSTMNGGWGAYKNGKVCFSGTWKSAAGNGFDSTCFAHKMVGGHIYQRRLPDGDWYVFKHAKPRRTDEYRKIVSGNHAKPRGE